MVAVPAHGAVMCSASRSLNRSMELILSETKLGRVIVAVVHQRGNAAGIDVIRAELRRADGVGFQTNAEDLGLDAREDLRLVIGNGQNFVHRLRVAAARREAVCRVILIAVGNQKLITQGLPVSSAKYSAMAMQRLPCSTQKWRTVSSGDESVRPSLTME